MLRDSSRHLVVGSALAFVGSVLAGTVVGLPAALAQSGLGQPTSPQTRLSGMLSQQDVALAADSIVAGDSPINLAVLTAGSPVKTAPVTAVAPPGSLLPGTPGAVLPGGVGVPNIVDPPTTGALGIPANMLDAYKKAAATKNRQSPQCNIDWSLLAAVGKVESDHAAGGKADATGRTRGDIQGPMTRYGTAKGPMQFLDSSWTMFGADGNGDGVKDVHNIYDAALAAANHLCSSGGGNLQNPENLRKGIFGYNRADWYVTKVINWMNQYSGRAISVPPSDGVIRPTEITPPPPVVDPVTPVAPAPAPEPSTPAPNPSSPSPEPSTPAPSPSTPGTTPSVPPTSQPSAPLPGPMTGKPSLTPSQTPTGSDSSTAPSASPSATVESTGTDG